MNQDQKVYKMMFQIGANLASTFNTSFGSACKRLQELAQETAETSKTLKDVSGFQKAKASVEESEQKLEKLRDEYRSLQTTIAAARHDVEKFPAAIEEQEKAIKETVKAISRHQQALQNYDEGTDAYKEINAELKKERQELREQQKEYKKLTAAQATAFVAGMTAGATYVESNTYRSVEGAVSVVGGKSHEQAVAAINAGEFFFSTSEAGAVVVEYDINSLITFADGKGEDYRKNRIIRVLDAFNDSLMLNFPPNKYDNNSTGWDIMEGVGKSILKLYYEAGAIDDVDYDNDFLVDRENSAGDRTYFDVGIKPVDSAEKLFFTVTTR